MNQPRKPNFEILEAHYQVGWSLDSTPSWARILKDGEEIIVTTDLERFRKYCSVAEDIKVYQGDMPIISKEAFEQ
jgi:hypothetical protein